MPRAHRFAIQVRFADTDALGHINNASYASWTESARLDFLASLEREGATGLRPPPGLDPIRKDESAPGLILARLELDFRRQVRFGEPVEVLTNVSRIGARSFTLRQLIQAGGTVAAEGVAVVVVFDYREQATRAMPPGLREALALYLEDPAGAGTAPEGGSRPSR